MRFSFLKKFLFIILLGIFLFQAASVFALEIKYPPLPGVSTPEEIEQKLQIGAITPGEQLGLYFQYFFNLAFAVVVIICAGVLVYGGVLYLLSPAQPAILVSAKSWIKSALLGLLILITSYAVLYTINPQLTIFPFERKLPQIPEKPKAEIPSPFIQYAYIPTGKLIEEKLDKLEETTTTVSGERLVLVNKVEQVVDEIETISKKLRGQLVELKNLTDNCSCGISQCQPGSVYDWGRARCWCKPQEIPCTIDCNKEAIIAQMEAVRKTIAELKTVQMKIVTLQTPLVVDDLELRTAGMLMSLPQDLRDYGLFAYEKLLAEEQRREIKPEVALAGWPELHLILESKIARIEEWTRKAKEATTTNQLPGDEILSKAGLIKHNIEDINQRIDEMVEKIVEAFRQGTLGKINQAITIIENHLPIIKEPLLSSIVNTFSPQIAAQAQTLQLVDYTREKIIKETKTPGEIQSIVEKIGDKIKDIEELVKQAKEASEAQQKLLALSKINLQVPIVRGYLYTIWEKETIVADPATFFYDPAIWENKEFKKETARLNPIIVFSETYPAAVNAQIAEKLKEILGPAPFEISEEGWDEIARRAVEEATREGVKDIFEALSETLAEKLRLEILKNFQEQIQSLSLSPSFLASLFQIQIASAQGDYQRKVVSDYLAEQLDEVLKTELPPIVESALERALAELLAIWAVKNAPDLLNPATYETFSQKLSEFYNTELQNLIPQLSEILSAELIDYTPALLADALNQVNDSIQTLIETFKSRITGEITKLTDAIFTKLGKSLGVGDGFLEVFIGAINIFLEIYTQEYIEVNILQGLDIYRWQRQLEGWLSLTIKDILPKKLQEDLGKPLMEYLRAEVPEIADFLQDVNEVILGIRNALTDKKGVIKEKIEKTTEKTVVDILLKDVKDILETKIYDLLLLSPDLRKILEYSIKDQIPSTLTQPLYNSFPEEAKTPLIDFLLPEYAETLKNNRLIDLIEDPEKKYCLTTPWQQIKAAGKAQECLGLLGESLIDMMGDEAKILTTPIMDLMKGEGKDFLNKTPLETLPEEFRQTGFQVLGLDDPKTPANEAKTKTILSYCSETMKILVQLIYQYLPDPKDRPQAVNKLLEIVNKSPYQFISEPLPPAGLGLGQPKIAEDLDKPLPEFLVAGQAPKEYLTEKTWVDILREIGVDLNQSLLERLTSEDPKLFRALTTKLGEIISETDLEENPDKTMLELISQKLTGDLSIAEKIQNKKLIELAGISFLSKTILELIQEQQNSQAHNIFSKSFYDFFPEEVKNRFESNMGEAIKNHPPFNQKVIELLPESWQKTIAEYFGIDIEQAIEDALQEINFEEEVNKVFERKKEIIANEIAKSLLKIYGETIGEKIAQDPEKLEQLSAGISEVLSPLVEKAIGEKLQKGYLLNSLKELF